MSERRTTRIVLDVGVQDDQWSISTGAPRELLRTLPEVLAQYVASVVQNAKHIRGSGAAVTVAHFGEPDLRREAAAVALAAHRAMIPLILSGELHPTVWSSSVYTAGVIPHVLIDWETTDVRLLLERALDEAEQRLPDLGNMERVLVLLIDEVRFTPDLDHLTSRVQDHPMILLIVGGMPDTDDGLDHTSGDDEPDDTRVDSEDEEGPCCDRCTSRTTAQNLIEAFRSPLTAVTALYIYHSHITRLGQRGLLTVWLWCAEIIAHRFTTAGITIQADMHSEATAADPAGKYALSMVELCQRNAIAEVFSLTPGVVHRDGGGNLVRAVTFYLAYMAAAVTPRHVPA